METSATSTAMLAKSTELTKESILDAIVKCSNLLDDISARRNEVYIPVPDWIEKLYTQYKADQAALAAFKKNSSYWPMQFPWWRIYHHGRDFRYQQPFLHEYRPVFSS